jgi:hypothetical protein
VLSSDALFATPTGYKQALAGVYGNLSLTGTGDAGSSSRNRCRNKSVWKVYVVLTKFNY